MKKKLCLLLAAVLLALCLAACGQTAAPAGKDSASADQPSLVEKPAEEAPAAEAPAEEVPAEEPPAEEAPAEEAPAEEAPPAEPVPAPSREDMRGHGKIAVPKDESWLSAYGTRYVCARGGVAAFLYYAPVSGSETFDNVLDGSPLTLLAYENGFYLVKTENGRVGWVAEIQTDEDTHILDSLPTLEGSYWIYRKGAGDENSYACFFGADRRVAGTRLSDGKRLSSTWALSMRRVKFDNMYFVWDGEQFVSRDEYNGPEGKIRYYLEPDPAQRYAQEG